MRRLLLSVLLLTPAVHAQGLDDALADLRLATAVRLAIAADPATGRVDSAVRARAGAVAVSADWPSPEARARAVVVARGVRGVADVTLGEGAPAPPAGLGTGVPAAEPDEEAPADALPSPEPEARVEPAPREESVEPVPVEAPAPVRADPEPPQPARPAPAADAAYHTVLLGDTLFSIARRHGTTVEALQLLNALGASTEISLGQRLRVR